MDPSKVEEDPDGPLRITVSPLDRPPLPNIGKQSPVNVDTLAGPEVDEDAHPNRSTRSRRNLLYNTPSTVSFLGFGPDNQLRRKTLRKRGGGGTERDRSNSTELSSWSIDSELSDDGSDQISMDEITLMFATHERIPKKDFRHEYEASKDVDSFFSMVALELDITETSLHGIAVKMVEGLLKEEPDCSAEEALSALFTHDSVHHFNRTMQGTSMTEYGSVDYDQSWICAFASMKNLKKRQVSVARLKHPRNLGETSQEIRFIIIVLAPSEEKTTRSALETARTFATLLHEPENRQEFLDCRDKVEFMNMLRRVELKYSKEVEEVGASAKDTGSTESLASFEKPEDRQGCPIGKGVWNDIKRRAPLYFSDFKDGLVGRHTLHKLISAIVFLYFACLLPSIAFGTLNSRNTHGAIDVRKVILSQTLGGLIYAMFSGQPLIILQTTAPLALYTQIIYEIAHGLHVDFLPMFGCVGLWSSGFVLLYALVGANRIMKYTTRCVEEIFALFIAITKVAAAFESLIHDFQENIGPDCSHNVTTSEGNGYGDVAVGCQLDKALLHLLLLLGTVALGMMLYNSIHSPYLDAKKREFLADYSLPVSVIFNSFIGVYVFSMVSLTRFDVQTGPLFVPVELGSLTSTAVVTSMGLGFCLSLLFFMDQNITAAIVNSPANKLKKSSAYNLDLLVIGIINGILSVFGLPWLHGTLPHSPLHVRALADVEDRVDQGRLYSIVVRVRETRLAAILSHILIGLSLLLLPSPLNYITEPVLNGLFIFFALISFSGNQFYERLVLILTDQSAYPPNHYIRRVPLTQIHLFTFCQVLQLAVLCGLGLSAMPYLEMIFPIVLLALLPIRHRLMPLLIDPKYIRALDAAHTDNH
ncbi:SLC4A11 [Branchiostoma lanceolatum]|uniref:SLC4A11 protein n=1 Tax=Branchiostoma lanceolatum TaxID=7740 RepID=A0A8K0EJA5_BRALA|nr:SLC4A11 [Branchiostoma lanceolatum]